MSFSVQKQKLSGSGHKCSDCGRELTDPKSIDRGVGPKCYAKRLTKLHEVQSTHHSLDIFNGEREIAKEMEKLREREIPTERGVFSEV